MKTIQQLRTEICHIAADLLVGEWTSPYREDLPRRTTRAMVQNIERDADHRACLSRSLKAVYDALGTLSTVRESK